MTTVLSLPPVIGHRGAASHAPENSLAGFDKAAALGARWVEFDVMLSADGVPVVHHDHDLARTGGRPERVGELPWAELSRVEVGASFDPAFAGERLPSLEQVVARLGALGLGANVEIKPAPGREAETAHAALAVLAARWPGHLPPPLISSFAPLALAAAAEAAPALPRGYLAERLPEDWAEAVAGFGCASVHLGWKALDAAAAAAVKAAGYLLAVWTVNDPSTALRCRGWGADAIITDVPDRILAAFAEAGSAVP